MCGMKIISGGLILISLLSGSVWAKTYIKDAQHQFYIKKPYGWREKVNKGSVIYFKVGANYSDDMKIEFIPMSRYSQIGMGQFSSKITDHIYKNSRTVKIYKNKLFKSRGFEFWEMSFQKSDKFINEIWAWKMNGMYYVIEGRSHDHNRRKILIAMRDIFDQFHKTVKFKNDVRDEMSQKSSGSNYYVNSTEFRLDH